MTSTIKELDKFKMQDSEYDFPYHYIPHIDSHGNPTRLRDIRWGLEYICYLKHIEEIIRSIKPTSLLDVGCGTGRFIGMQKNHIHRLVGVDLSNKAIKFAQAFHEEIEFICADAADLQEKFDVVTAVEVLEHVPDEYVGGFLRTLADRCNNGGTIVLSVPSKVTPVSKKHYRHYDIELFKNELEESKANLDIIKWEYVYKLTPITSIFRKLVCNKLWSVELNFLRGLVWRYVWNNLRIGTGKNGKHLVVTLIKK